MFLFCSNGNSLSESGESAIKGGADTTTPSPDDIGFPDTPEPEKEAEVPVEVKTQPPVPTPERTVKPSPDPDINFPPEEGEGKREEDGRTEQPVGMETRTPRAPPSSTKDPILVSQIMTTETPKKSSGSGSTNVGSVKDKDKKHNPLPMHIGLIVGIAVAVVILFLVLAYALYKYRSRDEGSYKIDESKNYSYETCNTKPPPHVNGGVSKTTKGQTSKPRKKDVKEWYV